MSSGTRTARVRILLWWPTVDWVLNCEHASKKSRSRRSLDALPRPMNSRPQRHWSQTRKRTACRLEGAIGAGTNPSIAAKSGVTLARTTPALVAVAAESRHSSRQRRHATSPDGGLKHVADRVVVHVSDVMHVHQLRLIVEHAVRLAEDRLAGPDDLVTTVAKEIEPKEIVRRDMGVASPATCRRSAFVVRSSRHIPIAR